MAKELIGTCDCPECGYDAAEISETKAELAMRYCPQCKAQYFPKKRPSSDLLIAKARPGTATGRHIRTAPEPAAPVQQQKPQPKPKPENPAPVQQQKPISVF